MLEGFGLEAQCVELKRLDEDAAMHPLEACSDLR
jgi:hypothetical protein